MVKHCASFPSDKHGVREMSSMNKAMVIGRLGKDCEMRFMPSGKAVANFSIATSESWKDKTTGEKQEKTEWHNIVMWRTLAETAEKLLKKGMQVYIEGRLQTRQWNDKDGNKRSTTEIVADQFVILQRRDQNQQNSGDSNEGTNSSDLPF